MEETITLKDVLNAVEGVKGEVQGLKDDLKSEVQGLKDDLKSEVQGLKGDVKSLRELVETNTESIEFIKEHAVTKDEMKEEMKKEHEKLRNEIIEHVDGFVGLYKKHDSELAAVISRQDRQEKKIEKIMVHVGMQPDMA